MEPTEPSPLAEGILYWNLEGRKVVLEEAGKAVRRVKEILSWSSVWDPSAAEYCLLSVRSNAQLNGHIIHG
nr:hypothetical protein PHYPA_005180 [Physcomitrium patens]